MDKQPNKLIKQQSTASPKNSSNQKNILSSLANTKNYPIMTIDQFKSELSQLASLDEKFGLLRSQFAPQLDPLQLDPIQQQQQQQQSQLSWNQLDLIITILDDIASRDTTLINEQVLHCRTEIQALVSAGASKVLTVPIMQEAYNGKHKRAGLIKRSMLTLSQWVYYLIAIHEKIIKPDFIKMMMNKVTNLGSFLVSLKEKTNIPRLNNLLTVESMMGNLGPTRAQSQQVSFPSMSLPVHNTVQLIKDSEDEEDFKLQIDHDTDDQDVVGETTDDLMEAAIFSLFILTLGVFQITPNQAKQQELALISLLLPLVKISNLFDNFTGHPFSKDLSTIIANDLPLLSMVQTDVGVMKPCLNGVKTMCETSITYLILSLCHVSTAQIASKTKPQANSKQQSLSMTKNDKFAQTLQIILVKHLSSYLAYYKKRKDQDNIMDIAKYEQLSSQARQSAKFDELELLISQQSRSEEVIVGIQTLDTREQQMNWLKMSQILLTLSIDCLKSLSSYQLGSFTQTLLRQIFDLFKSTIFFSKHMSLTESDEFFDNLLNCDKLSDLVILPETNCPIVHAFQIMMHLSQCEQKNLFDGFYTEFEDICRLIHLGCFERVDPKSYITAIYLTFLDDIVCCNEFVAQNNKKYVEEVNMKSNPPQIIEYLLKFYNNNYYPDSRMKDVETNNFIKTKANYKIVLQKFQQYEMRFATTSSQRSGQNNISAVQLTNRTLIQQQSFELISYYAGLMPIVNAVCLKYVIDALSEIKYETSQLRVYQIIKLAVVILKSGQFSNNKDYYELFVNTPSVKQNNREFKTWYLSPKCKLMLQSTVLQTWDSLFKIVKQHVLARYQIQKRNVQQSSRAEEINNMMGGQIEDGLLGENQFEILKKFLVFGLTNFEIAALLSKQMKDFVKEVKDFEHSYEIKISIYQCRIILKDKHQSQEETLTLLFNLLKSLYEHIGMVQKNMTNIKPSLASGRRQDDTTLEQEQINKVKQIKYLVMQSVNILTNYLDFKEVSDQSNLSLPTDVCEAKSGLKQLDMLIQSKKGFEAYLMQIKKIILRYQLEMSGSILVEQLLRVFFFERREVQNLCLINRNASNDQLLDQMSHKTLDTILNFIIEATEQMNLNAPMIVKSFVQFLYNKLIEQEHSKDGRQHIQLLRFARTITPQMIKQIKKIMIFIREKDDQIKECAKQFQLVMIKCLCSVPNTVVFKEFFTFFREIFYYHQDMDEVDFSLSIDTLKIFNQVLKHPQSPDKKKSSEFPQSQKGVNVTDVTDYFMFSDFSPGVILSDNFRIPSETFSIALLFKINVQQIKALQQKSGGLDGSPLTMTFFQIINKSNSDTYPPFSIIINILNNKLKIYDFECKFDEAWHFLLVSCDYKKRLKGGPVTKVKIYIDNLQKPVNTDKIQHMFQKNTDHIFAYGCDAIDIFAGQKPNNQVSVQMTQIVNNLIFNNEFKAHNFFQGQLSLLLMFTKFEFEKHDLMKSAFQDFLVDLISNKQTVSIGTHELVVYMRQALKLTAKDKDLGTFESHEFNEQVIIRHQLGCGINHLSTQHLVKPSEILVVMGGFKALYPIFDKSLTSNLSVFQKSKIWLYLFKVLHTLMFVEPQHVLRLFKSKYLIETLRSCLLKCGLSSGFMITKDLTTEILSIAKAASKGGVLEEFYRRYIFEVVLDETICELGVNDRGRKIKMFEESAECMYAMFIDEENDKDKFEKQEERRPHQVAFKMQNEYESEQKSKSFFFSQGTSEKIYQLIMRLIIRYSEPEYILQTKKLAYILRKMIVRYQQKENFGKLIESIQQSDSKKQKQLNQAALLAHLKIFEGVIKEPYFYKSTQLMQALRSQYRREAMELHLNQSSYLKQNTSSDIDVKLADNIIAVALRIIIDIQAKSQDAPAPQMPPRNVYMNALAKTPNDDEKSLFVSQLLKALKANPKGISMQKTVCSLIIAAIEKKQKIKKTSNQYARVKYNPAFLKQILKDRQVNNILEIMRSSDFDQDLFSLTIKLFKRYDLDTKLVLLDFYRQLIEEGNLLTTIESFDAFKDLKFLHLMKDLIKSNQEKYILNIVNAAIQAKEPEIVQFIIRIVASVIKCFFNTSLQIDNEGVVYEEEIKYLKSIKKLFLILESKEDALFNVLNDVLKYVQEVVNWVWSFYLHDTNRTNLNLKLVLFLQMIEEMFMKKIGKTGVNAEYMGLITSKNFLEVLARLLIIFEDTKMLYFDYPNPSIVDTMKRDTNVATGMIRVKQTMLSKDIQFLEGGPLRIFISVFLQLLRKLKPNENAKGTQEESKTSGKIQKSIERSQNAYNLVVEMFNYYLFKKESSFVNNQRPVSTIEPPTPEGLNQSPLFKIFKNLLNTGLSKKNQYVLQPLDLTKQFIEINSDFFDQKESIAQTPGFLPLLLINELFDIVRRKYLQMKQLQQEDQGFKNQIISILELLYEIMSQAYIFEEFQDTVGTIMIIITDARLKDEIYCNMTPRKLNARGRGAKPFLLAKAAELFLQSKSTVYQRSQYQMMASSEIDLEMPTPTNQNEESLPFNMNEQHFQRRSEAIERNILPKNNQQEVIGTNDHSMVDKIRRAEEQERHENTKDFAQYQDEVMSFITQCYSDLSEFFKKGQTQKLSDQHLIAHFKEKFIHNE